MLDLIYFAPKELAEYIRNMNKKVYIYGAGMIGSIVIPSFFKKYKIEKYAKAYIDNDKRKQGKYVDFGSDKIAIHSSDYINNVDKNDLILITNSNYSPVLSMLDTVKQIDKVKTVIFPIVEAIEAGKNKHMLDITTTSSLSNDLIPKVIHYCWFSGKEMPDYLKRCVDSWHQFCPDYEIKRWDESNYDITKNVYMKQAYEAKKWGFVPDYARLDILYNYGGFYLDTDVELIKSLDTLRGQEAFCGVEKWGNINMGGCSGAVKQHTMIKRMLDYRENIPFVYKDGTYNLETCGVYETKPFIEEGMSVDNTTQRIHNMTVFSSDFFHPYDYMSGETCITKNTYSIHHFNGGWLDEKRREERKQTSEAYKKILKRMQV